ncbi:MAG: thiamine-phosphate kinase [Helicobacteraceae bacterium]|nr:thiamine-phosphate kinase [Helicobacteraceae bacterium]
MNTENYFISTFKNSYIGDDGAVIDGFVYSKDAFFENVHFKRSWLSLEQIAYKAMIVNISDAIAMNATPKYALLSVAMPRLNATQMRELNSGFTKAANEFNVQIVGGDTISNTKLDITVTIISKTEKPLLRKGLKVNHFMAYTGELGKSAKELRYLLSGKKIHKNSKFINIKLRSQFIKEATKHLSCGMDISDGVYSDLQKLSKANRVGFKFLKKMPKSVGCSGEEYEMLIGFSKSAKNRLLAIAKKHRVKLNIFAITSRSSYTNRCKAHHF